MQLAACLLSEFSVTRFFNAFLEGWKAACLVFLKAVNRR